MPGPGTLSIRRALVAGMLAMALVPALIVGVVGVHNLNRSVRDEAQARVKRILGIAMAAYADEVDRLQASLETAAERVAREAGTPIAILATLRRELDLDVLALTDATGRPLDGRAPEATPPIPLAQDPILRQALMGRPAGGTVILDSDRLLAEGGPALQSAVRLPVADDPAGAHGSAALVRWVAAPVRDTAGRITGVLYGGRVLNHDNALVDRLRNVVFGDTGEPGRPLGTVTVFLHDVRAATNVPGPGGGRAVGTRVSEAVRAAVLERGEDYTGEALVVDEWYLAAYTPLRDPDGRTIGMLYVGLPRRPYDEARDRLILGFLLPVGLVGLLAVVVGLSLARRITGPVQALDHAVTRLADGDWEHRLRIPPSYREIGELAAAYDAMQTAIHRRDLELRARNDELTVTNEKLDQSNRNYMETLAFVTHELKAPLGAIQMLVSNVLDGTLGPVPERMSSSLSRVRRSVEDLQDMVRDYLDLSRLERGELVARPHMVDLVKAVVEPAVDHTSVFFGSRGIALRVEAPAELTATADPDLLRVAVNNFLTNAAKYGREKGNAVLKLRREEGQIRLTVWNEGEGFSPQEAEHLFDKFVRLRNAATQRNRGSGVGLFTVRNIAALHGGRAWAESEPGAWAAFHLSFRDLAGKGESA
ncbi:MAG TPA: cache domain-containing protein [Longimicrobiales bacterium]|nr:cache domain-containing protein [Longimicrobiales bacterium]